MNTPTLTIRTDKDMIQEALVAVLKFAPHMQAKHLKASKPELGRDGLYRVHVESTNLTWRVIFGQTVEVMSW